MFFLLKNHSKQLFFSVTFFYNDNAQLCVEVAHANVEKVWVLSTYIVHNYKTGNIDSVYANITLLHIKYAKKPLENMPTKTPYA